MGIKATYNKAKLFEEFDDNFNSFLKQATNLFFELGKRAVDLAVADGNYINRTGVLRSSIGCGVSYQGVLLRTYGFFSFGDPRGVQEGRELLDILLKKDLKRNELRLVVVAGANYASFVEQMPDYRVLERGASFIESNLESVLSRLKYL